MNRCEDYKTIMDKLAEEHGDEVMRLRFRDVKEGMDSFLDVIGITMSLVHLIRRESELKKHHRAYLHVREDIERQANEALLYISEMIETMGETDNHCPEEEAPFADAEDEEAVLISKEQLATMLDDVLTLAELVELVTEMRCRDLAFINQYARHFPAFAAFEKNRLDIYKDARLNAEEILNRWDEDFEADEYFSD